METSETESLQGQARWQTTLGLAKKGVFTSHAPASRIHLVIEADSNEILTTMAKGLNKGRIQLDHYRL
jgi:hypothetical protein